MVYQIQEPSPQSAPDVPEQGTTGTKTGLKRYRRSTLWTALHTWRLKGMSQTFKSLYNGHAWKRNRRRPEGQRGFPKKPMQRRPGGVEGAKRPRIDKDHKKDNLFSQNRYRAPTWQPEPVMPTSGDQVSLKYLTPREAISVKISQWGLTRNRRPPTRPISIFMIPLKRKAISARHLMSSHRTSPCQGV